jgi:hypothetical protein
MLGLGLLMMYQIKSHKPKNSVLNLLQKMISKNSKNNSKKPVH